MGDSTAQLCARFVPLHDLRFNLALPSMPVHLFPASFSRPDSITWVSTPQIPRPGRTRTDVPFDWNGRARIEGDRVRSSRGGKGVVLCRIRLWLLLHLPRRAHPRPFPHHSSTIAQGTARFRTDIQTSSVVPRAVRWIPRPGPALGTHCKWQDRRSRTSLHGTKKACCTRCSHVQGRDPSSRPKCGLCWEWLLW